MKQIGDMQQNTTKQKHNKSVTSKHFPGGFESHPRRNYFGVADSILHLKYSDTNSCVYVSFSQKKG